MKKRFVLLLLALLIAFSSCAFAAPRATATPKPLDQSVFPIDGSTAEADLNLRATAYSRGRIVDTLRKGLRVTVTAASTRTTAPSGMPSLRRAARKPAISRRSR